MVLIDRARPERLGEMVRHLCAEKPDTEVLLEAPLLATLPVGSTVVLCLREKDSTWLNLARPVVASRALRLFLWSDESTTVALVRGAIDFFDWISHRIECPPGPPGFAEGALRRAACQRAAAVVWQGTEGDLGATFEHSLPGRGLEWISAASPYPSLVRALQPLPRRWVAVTDIDAGDLLQRVQWACAEAGRNGRTVLVDPAGAGALPVVDTRAMVIDEAAERLRNAGSLRPARLAALLNLSEEGVGRAAALLARGVAESDVERRISGDGKIRSADGEEGSSPGEQATSQEGERAKGADRRSGWLKRLGAFSARVSEALEVGDFAVARYWAAGWSEAQPERAEPWTARARLEVWVGDLDLAGEMIGKARQRLGTPAMGAATVDLLMVEGQWHDALGEADKARADAEQGLRLARKAGLTNRVSEISADLVFALCALQRAERAAALMKDWSRAKNKPTDSPADGLHAARSQAMVHAGRQDWQAAVGLLQTALRELPARHVYRARAEAQLAGALISLGRGQEALQASAVTLAREERLGGPLHEAMHAHGRALLTTGRLKDAEATFGRALGLRGKGLFSAEVGMNLTLCLQRQGRLDEAQAVIQRVLALKITHVTPMALSVEAGVFLEAGRLRDAIQSLESALAFAKKIAPGPPQYESSILISIARFLLASNRPREAELHLRRAVHLAEQVRDTRAQATAWKLVASAQKLQGFPQAADTLRRAEELDRRADAEGARASEPLDPLAALPRI